MLKLRVKFGSWCTCGRAKITKKEEKVSLQTLMPHAMYDHYDSVKNLEWINGTTCEYEVSANEAFTPWDGGAADGWKEGNIDIGTCQDCIDKGEFGNKEADPEAPKILTFNGSTKFNVFKVCPAPYPILTEEQQDKLGVRIWDVDGSWGKKCIGYGKHYAISTNSPNQVQAAVKNMKGNLKFTVIRSKVIE